MRAKEVIAAFLLVLLAAVPSFSQAAPSHAAPSRQAQVKQHSQLAQQYLSERRPDLAIPELKAVVALEPKNLDARANLGVLLFFRGEYADAVPQLRAALKLQPDLWKIQALLGMSEERLGQQTEGRQDLR